MRGYSAIALASALAPAVALLVGCNQLLGVGDPHLSSGDGGGGDGNPGDGNAPTDAEPSRPDAHIFMDAGLAAGPRYRAITIAADKVQTSVTGFPVFVALSDPDLVANALGSGADVQFATPTGTTMIGYQLEHYLPGQSSYAQLTAWVGVDLSTTAATTFYLCYGSGTAVSRNPYAMWQTPGAQYRDVFHFDDAGSGAITGAPDSGNNGELAQVNQAQVERDSPAANSNGILFAQTGRLQFNSSAAPPLTLSFLMIHPATFGGNEQVFTSQGGDFGLQILGPNQVELAGTTAPTPTNLTGTHIFHVTMSNTNQVALYIDGVEIVTANATSPKQGQLTFGDDTGPATTAVIDEIRILQNMESVQEMQADLATITSASFYTVGPVTLGSCP